MERPLEPVFNAQIYQRACEWFVEFRSHQPDESARRAFYQWLQESPQHIGAYLHITAVWSEGSSLGGRQEWTPESLIANAAADESNVVAIDPSGADSKKSTTRDHREANEKRPTRSRWGRLVVAACVLITLAGLSSWLLSQRGTFITAIGEQRFIALPDGSTVNLNSRSKLRVRTFERERVVELLEGQALFDVAKDPLRPFVVISGGTRVRAVGTQFDVYRKGDDTIVTVVEGRVSVRRQERVRHHEAKRPDGGLPDSQVGRASPREAGRSVEEVLLSAGQQLHFTSSGVPQSAVADVARVTSWTQRQMVFESTPLAEVVEEFNRYNPRQMIIRSTQLNNFQIDGVFSSTDPGSLIRFLRTRPGVHVTETDAEITIESR
jgi:transmembrane sensor